MESLTDAFSDSLLDLTPNYDATKQTFLLDSQESASSSSVRLVTKKLIPAQHPPNAFGGGSKILDPKDYKSKPLYDSFSGLIDGISGDLLHGTRSYVLTKEIYEGPFQNNIRHGEGAIVKNIYQPSPNSVPGVSSPLKVVPEGSRFYGEYRNDSPLFGTLVVPGCCTYHGYLFESRPHGEGTMIQCSGHKYEGEFRHGMYHGQGTETETTVTGGGVYSGQFVSGLRQGYGTYTILPNNEFKEKECTPGESPFSENFGKESERKYYKYDGQWNANQRQGEGEEQVLNGEIYRGQFHSNERHGYGVLTFPPSNSCTKNLVDECSQRTASDDPSKVIVSVEGIWRASTPLNGTHGWTITYQNGDVYTGFASDFIPSGYGVKRYKNRDIYSGEWVNGKREGEGIFIAANCREEYIGDWVDDKIVPVEEGKDDARRITLTDLTLSLLNGTIDSDPKTKPHEDEEDNYECDSDYNIKSINSSDHQRRRELFSQIMHKSLSTSLELLNSVQSPECSERPYPQSWSPGKKKSLTENPKAYLYENALSLLKKKEVSSNESLESKSDVSELQENEDESDTSDDKDELNQTQLITYPNGDTYLGEICSETRDREGYGVYLSVASGSTYAGNFKLNLRHGFGILIHPLGKYCGDFVDDDKHGMGTLILNDSRYVKNHCT